MGEECCRSLAWLRVSALTPESCSAPRERRNKNVIGAERVSDFPGPSDHGDKPMRLFN